MHTLCLQLPKFSIVTLYTVCLAVSRVLVEPYVLLRYYELRTATQCVVHTGRPEALSASRSLEEEVALGSDKMVNN